MKTLALFLALTTSQAQPDHIEALVKTVKTQKATIDVFKVKLKAEQRIVKVQESRILDLEKLALAPKPVKVLKVADPFWIIMAVVGGAAVGAVVAGVAVGVSN